MKRILFSLFCSLLITSSLFAQERKHSTYYYQRTTLFETLPVAQSDIIFLGNSITDGCEWSELFDNKQIKNRGISGDIAMGVYDRLDPILKGKPSKIFLLIGINDVSRGTPADTIVQQIGLIVEKIKQDSPYTRLYLQSVLPVNDCYNMFQGHTSRWQMVPEINRGLQAIAEKEKVTYIDLYSHFIEKESGKLRPDFSNDGLHLMGAGYLKWRDIVKSYIEDVTPANPKEFVSKYPDYTTTDVTTAWNSFVYQYQDACKTKKIFSANPRVDATNKKTLAAIWVQAIYLDMAMNRYNHTHKKADKKFVDQLLIGNYNHYAKFDFDDENQETGWFIYDDIMWWTGALSRAAALYGKKDGKQYLEYAERSYNRVLFGSTRVGDPGSWDQVKGGMYWNWAKPAGQGWDKRDNGKAACINFPTVIAAMSLYQATGKEEYFSQAKAIYGWAREHLIRTDGYVFDMFHSAPNGHDNLYNSGTAIGAAVSLYLQTKEKQYLNDAILIADYVKNVKCAPTNGYLPVRYGEEQGIYAAIFAQYISQLITDCGQQQYLPWLRYNINAGWANRNQANNITCSDFQVKLTTMSWNYTDRDQTKTKSIQSYEASAIPALMLVIPPKEESGH